MEQAEGFDPDDRFSVERTLASAHLTLGEFSEAAAIYERMLPEFEFGADSDADFELTMGFPQCYSELGQHDKAIGILRKLIASGTRADEAQKPLIRHAVHELGRELMRVGQVDEAVEVLEELLAEVPPGTELPWRPDVMLSLASAYRALGRSEERAQLKAKRREETLAHLETAYADLVDDEERSAKVLVPVGSRWRWNLPAEAERAQIVAHFSEANFDDSGWALSEDSLLGGFGIEREPNQWIDTVNLGGQSAPEKPDGGLALFRHSFTTNEPQQHLELHAQVADGVIVFLDGVEVARGGVNEGEDAAKLHAGQDRVGYSAWTPLRIPLKGRLEPGEHLLAISLHRYSDWKYDLRLAGIQLVSWSGPAPDRRLADEPLMGPKPGPFDPAAFADTMHGLSLREVRQGNQARAREALALSMIGRLLTDEWKEAPNALVDRYKEWRALADDQDPAPAPAALINRGAGWKYHPRADDSTVPAGWSELTFDDSDWASTGAPLGYGDEAVAGHVAHSEGPEDKPRTVLFRRTFAIHADDPHAVLSGRIRVDDGAAVYLNGEEVHRLRLPEGSLDPSVFASKAVFGDAEATYEPFQIPAHLLVPGENLIAVEVHQVTAESSDILFDLELQGISIKVLRDMLGSVQSRSALDQIRRTYELGVQDLPSDWRENIEMRLQSLSEK